VRSFSVDGCIQMKSFLKGSPQVHLALNEDLQIASAGERRAAPSAYGAVQLDDVNFHECAARAALAGLGASAALRGVAWRGRGGLRGRCAALRGVAWRGRGGLRGRCAALRARPQRDLVPACAQLSARTRARCARARSRPWHDLAPAPLISLRAPPSRHSRSLPLSATKRRRASRCVGLDRFDSERVLTLTPPSGEFVVMNFRVGTLRSERQLPFRLWPTVHVLSEFKKELQVTVKADFPDKLHAVNVRVSFTVPKSVSSATLQLPPTAARGTQSATYNEATRLVEWTVKKWPGGAALSLSAKLTVPATCDLKKEMGPIRCARAPARPRRANSRRANSPRRARRSRRLTAPDVPSI
jgi:hypothetical protein